MLSPKRTPIRRSADLSKETLQTTTEGLVTYSTLTQGKAVPREGQERAREKVLPTESQQILGGESPFRRWWFWSSMTAKGKEWATTADVSDPSCISECCVLFLPPALNCLCDRRQQDKVNQNSSF